MPDPTPTTEATERQCPLMHHHAAHALCPGLTYDDVANMAEDAAFDAAAEQGRAAADRLMGVLAASPAPTGTPDEPCGDCGHPHEDHSQGDPPDYSCWHVYVSDPGGCDCEQYARPAAVTAPREDERVSRAGITTDEQMRRVREVFSLAAAPAVERVTPDPDTLAAIVAEAWANAQGLSLDEMDPADREGWLCWAALATPTLIAAGVTLNQPEAGA